MTPRQKLAAENRHIVILTVLVNIWSSYQKFQISIRKKCNIVFFYSKVNDSREGANSVLGETNSSNFILLLQLPFCYELPKSYLKTLEKSNACLSHSLSAVQNLVFKRVMKINFANNKNKQGSCVAFKLGNLKICIIYRK